ncbi:MAG TPA: DUF2806 domain-containing protein [Polyangiaceae bacterium]|nr:DUF2806 domain-containing protein [Polyangiaceae bacterium]
MTKRFGVHTLTRELPSLENLDVVDPGTAITAVKAAVGGLAAAPVVKKSLLKAMGRLIAGVADVPAAWLESKAQVIRDETAARSAVNAELARAAVHAIGGDPALGERSLKYLGARILREQANREFVAAAAAEELRANPPAEDSETEISADWLDVFSRFAESRSDQDVQLYFAKVLAGEIRKPGSFSPATMDALARLSPTAAKLFQLACAITTCFCDYPQVEPALIVEPIGRAGQNALKPFGLSYSALTVLQSAGLIHTDLNAWRELPKGIFASTVAIGGKRTRLVETSGQPPVGFDPNTPIRFNAINLTQAGCEIQTIVHAEPNAEYLGRLKAWIASTVGLPLAQADGVPSPATR